MTGFTIFLLCLNGALLGLASLAGFFLYRASKRLLEFDELFDMMVDELTTNVRYVQKLASTSTFSNSPEIMSFQKNLRVMTRRLGEFAVRMRETSRKDFEIVKENQNPPVVA